MLDLVRPAEDVRSGMSRLEADAIEEALHSDVMKAPWIDMIVSEVDLAKVCRLALMFLCFSERGKSASVSDSMWTSRPATVPWTRLRLGM